MAGEEKKKIENAGTNYINEGIFTPSQKHKYLKNKAAFSSSQNRVNS